MIDKSKKDWWKDAVVYQVYLRSFYDTATDGFGDLPGLDAKLDYIKSLGVDAIWITPVYRSPFKDVGYDVSNYYDIDPVYGNMESFKKLLKDAKERDLEIVMGLVLDYLSDEHPWFKAARKDRNSPYHDYFIWRDGEPGQPPSDMKNSVGDSVWTYVPEVGQYYYGTYSRYQPDLNWENENLRRDMYDVIRFWRDQGVGGFHIDSIESLAKDIDNDIAGRAGGKLHDLVREMREQALPDERLLLVGEFHNVTPEEGRRFANPDGTELSMMFQYESLHLDQGESRWDRHPIDPAKLKQTYAKWQNEMYGRSWNSLFLGHHDQPRVVSRWGNEGKFRAEAAKMLAVMRYLMQGTPFLYQGEEIGMANHNTIKIDEVQDIEALNYYLVHVGAGEDERRVMDDIHSGLRDNARTPMQWSAEEHAGFSAGKPWMPPNPDYKDINVAAQEEDPESILNFYRKLMRTRREYPVFRDGTFTLLEPENDQTICYTRDTDDEHVLVQCNFTPFEQDELVPEGFENAELLLQNYTDAKGPLKPYETRVLYAKN